METYSTASFDTTALDKFVFMAKNKKPAERAPIGEESRRNRRECLRSRRGLILEYSIWDPTYDIDALRAFARICRGF